MLIITILGILLAESSFAFSFPWSKIQLPEEDLTGYSKEAIERIQKTKLLLEKNEKCYAGVLTFDLVQQTSTSEPGWLPKIVYCIDDIVVAPSTINEKRGCGLITYNIENGRDGPFANFIFPTPIVEKSCAAGGFELLLQQKGRWAPHCKKDQEVSSAVFEPIAKGKKPPRHHLVKASSKSVVEWYTKETAKLRESKNKTK